MTKSIKLRTFCFLWYCAPVSLCFLNSFVWTASIKMHAQLWNGLYGPLQKWFNTYLNKDYTENKLVFVGLIEKSLSNATRALYPQWMCINNMQEGFQWYFYLLNLLSISNAICLGNLHVLFREERKIRKYSSKQNESINKLLAALSAAFKQ